MTKRLKLAVCLGLGAVAIAIGASATATRSAEAAHPQVLAEDRSRICVAERAGARTEPGWNPGTLALVLASVPEPEQVLSALEEQLELAEESNNPMALDLDADASEQKRLKREIWPRITAAQTWQEPELERKGYALVPCSDAAARYTLWREHAALPPATPQLRQQAWAMATLAVIRSGDAERLRARLRNRSAEPDSAIALVVGPLTRIEGLSALGARAKRLAERARRAERAAPPLLALLARATDSAELPIALGAGDLAVVPRLAALSRLAEFSAEIERALDSGDRFVHRPEPIVASDANSGRPD